MTITGVAAGTATVRASAPGYAEATLSVPVSNNVISVGNVELGPGGTGSVPVTLSQPAPAGGVAVSLASSDPAKATVPPTVTIPQGNLAASLDVTGVAAGTGLTITATGALISTVTATVNVAPPPALSYAYPGAQLGKDEQGTGFYVSLGAPAPAGGVTVTLTSLDPTRLLLAPNNATSVGSATLAVPVPAGQTTASYALQALADNGTVGVTASASGYTGTSGTHPLSPLGFYISTGDLTTTTLSANTDVTVCSAVLTPGTLTVLRYTPALRPGVTPVALTLASDTPSVGTIVNSPRSLGAGQSCTSQLTPNFQFDPVGAGTATLSLSTPAGYATPSNAAQARTATVTP